PSRCCRESSQSRVRAIAVSSDSCGVAIHSGERCVPGRFVGRGETPPSLSAIMRCPPSPSFLVVEQHRHPRKQAPAGSLCSGSSCKRRSSYVRHADAIKIKLDKDLGSNDRNGTERSPQILPILRATGESAGMRGLKGTEALSSGSG